MKDNTRRVDILHISEGKPVRRLDIVVKEAPVTIFLDNIEIVTLMCTPKDLDFLAVGLLFGEGLIKKRKEIKTVFSDTKEGAVWVETVAKKRLASDILSRRYVTSGCGRGLTFSMSNKTAKRAKAMSGPRLQSGQISSLMREFQSRSRIFRETGGVHSAALAKAGRIIVFNEDVGRHNAIDKVVGENMLRGAHGTSLVLITSGRVSSDILAKASMAKIQIILSKSAPTDLAVRLARDLGLTLIGFARGPKMNVYSNEWRVRDMRSNERLKRKR